MQKRSVTLRQNDGKRLWRLVATDGKLTRPESDVWPGGSTYAGVSEHVVVFVDYGDGKRDVLVDRLQLQLHVTGLGLGLAVHKDEPKTWNYVN